MRELILDNIKMSTTSDEKLNPVLKLKRLGKDLENLIKALSLGFPRAILEHSHSLLIIIVLTVLFILAQETFLWACPSLIKFSAPIALFLDMIFLYIDFLADILAAGWDVIALIIDKIPGLDAKLKPLPVWPFTTSKGLLALPSPSGVKAWLVRVHTECGGPGYFNAYQTLNYAFATINGNSVCAFVRYLYPVPPLFDMFNYLLGPFFIGSAVPNPAPALTDDNCLLAKNALEAQLPEPTCIVLGTGWIMLEVVIPFYLGIIFFARCGLPVWHLFLDVLIYLAATIKVLLF